VGCGAAAREFVLPVLRKYPGAADRVVLVDSNLEQARATAHQYGFKHTCDSHRSLPLDIDAALITTPHMLHARQSLDFLQQGCHVFVEKPLGMTIAEVDAMLAAADEQRRVLMVNNYRRLFPSYRRVHELLRSGQLGELRRIIVLDGTQFAWQSATSFYLRDPSARGVLLDRGSHTLDTLCWWLGETPRVVAARWDAMGGVEALMDLSLSARDARIQVKFSRLYRLPNRFIIEGTRATLMGRLFDYGQLHMHRNGATQRIDAGKTLPHSAYAWQLVANFLQSVAGHEAPLFTAADVRPSIGVIEEAYAQSKPLDAPWYQQDPNIASPAKQFAGE
jgi:predicted dehydrogenase